MKHYGSWAIVAGASSGLGAEFARQLATHGYSLLLLARRSDALAVLAAELRAAHAVEVRTLAIDLASPGLLEEVRQAARDLEIGVLVYNAAFAPIGAFIAQPLDDLLRVIDVNCRAPLILARELGAQMAERGRGGILLMSSMAGSRGAPLVAAYGASKAFNLVLAEGLWDELASRGVDVLACRAGATQTPAYEASAPEGKVPIMASRDVVTEALAALGRGPSMIPGRLNRFVDFFLSRFLSRRAGIRMMSTATRKLYRSRAAT